jgi:PTH1 family peptidyl-tRNA hydrolase
VSLVRVVVGLGNPGSDYADTRHNVGFMLVDRLARRFGVALEERAGCRRGRGGWDGEDYVLVEPLRFMNRSGPPLRAALEELGLEGAPCLVVHDELDLPFGRIKLKRGGGTGGHRGLRSIVESLGSGDFDRLRIGIGRPPPGSEAVDHVLEGFSEADREALEAVLSRAEDAVMLWAKHGIEAAMNRVNAGPIDLEGSERGC